MSLWYHYQFLVILQVTFKFQQSGTQSDNEQSAVMHNKRTTFEEAHIHTNSKTSRIS